MNRIPNTVVLTVVSVGIVVGGKGIAEPIEWRVDDGGNGHFYESISLPATWTDANSHAQQQYFDGMPGHLATISSVEENAFIWNSLDAARRWLGGFETGSGWVWVTGEPFVFTNWFPGEPNNFGGNEDYLQFSPDSQSGQWNDNSNDGRLSGIDVGYIIEFEPPDFDADGVPDESDNCTETANTDQRDTDLDGFGNICDADLSQDCNTNYSDLALFKSVFGSSDPTADFDGDGQVAFADIAILKSKFLRPPGPSGLPNPCD